MDSGRARLLIGLALALGLLAAPACGFRERRAQAEFVIDTAERARRAGAVQVVMTQSLRPLEIIRADIETHPFPIPIAGALDVAGRRAAPGVTVPGSPSGVAAIQTQPTSTPFLVFDRELLYIHRLAADEGERP